VRGIIVIAILFGSLPHDCVGNGCYVSAISAIYALAIHLKGN
jgi:hypothetical protein